METSDRGEAAETADRTPRSLCRRGARTMSELTSEELSRLERQRANKRKWARKEREKCRRELDHLKQTRSAREHRKQALQEHVEKLLKSEEYLKDVLADHDCHLEAHGTAEDGDVLASTSHGCCSPWARRNGVRGTWPSGRSTRSQAGSTTSTDSQKSSVVCPRTPPDKVKPSSVSGAVSNSSNKPSSVSGAVSNSSNKPCFADRSALSQRDHITAVSSAASSDSKHCRPAGCPGTSISKAEVKAKPDWNPPPGSMFLHHSQAISNEDEETDQSNQKLSIDAILKAARAISSRDVEEQLEGEPGHPSSTAGKTADFTEAVFSPVQSEHLSTDISSYQDFMSEEFVITELDDNDQLILQLLQGQSASSSSRGNSSSIIDHDLKLDL